MPEPALADIVNYQNDADASLRVYFSSVNPNFAARFASYLNSEVIAEREDRLNETDIRSAMVIMARVEGAFWIDYKRRLQLKQSDDVSIAFRKIAKKQRARVRLDDLWEIWKSNLDNPEKALISKLKGIFKYRHWLAHGRHWQAGNRFDFQTIYPIVDAVFQRIPLQN